MILAQHAHGSDTYGPVLPASSATASRRGDVTTMRAADFVRLQAAKRVEMLQGRLASHETGGALRAEPGAVWPGLRP